LTGYVPACAYFLFPDVKFVIHKATDNDETPLILRAVVLQNMTRRNGEKCAKQISRYLNSQPESINSANLQNKLQFGKPPKLHPHQNRITPTNGELFEIHTHKLNSTTCECQV
jgi:hypothetical protein